MAFYKLSQKADDDLKSLYRYGVVEFGFKRADEYFDSICLRFSEIAENPMLYQAVDFREGYRRSVHQPHVIYYRIVDSETVEIVRILRSQNPQQSI